MSFDRTSAAEPLASARTDGQHAAARRRPPQGGDGYHAQVQRLSPTGDAAAASLTIAGVTLTAAAVGATFERLEHALGDSWRERARAAAKDGGDAVLRTLADLVPAAVLRAPLAHDVASAYARWASRRPSSERDADRGATAQAGGSHSAGSEGQGERPIYSQAAWYTAGGRLMTVRTWL